MTADGGIHGVESRDGKSLLFTKPASAGLWLRDFATGHQRLLVESVLPGDWTNWAAARDRVFFVDRDTTGSQRLVEVPFERGKVRVLLDRVVVPVGTGGVALSNDERSIAFGKIRRREANLYRVKAN